MSDPPVRTTPNGQQLVLVDPTDRRVSAAERQELSLEEFRAMEDALLEESAGIISAALAFKEIEPGTTVPPEEWTKALGFKKAQQKLRIANAAWMSNKEAPIGLKMSLGVYNGISRIRAGDQQIHQQLNYTVVQLPGPLPSFPEKEVEGRK